uniref:Polysaccharide pyruvyl transferase family protein n=2 Tax=unclassified Mycobacterium TaxID=2642494 RepID=A0A5Q5BFT2_MYCSS
MSIAAAEGNLGDLFIRRTVTRLVQAKGHEAVLYTGKMGKSYVDAFELPPNWVATPSPMRFLKMLAASCFQRRAVIVMAPAPARLDAKISAVGKRLGVALLIALSSALGNHVAVMGRAIRGSGFLALCGEKLIARCSSLYIARDKQTVLIAGGRAQFKPDLGFAAISLRIKAESTLRPTRNIVALSLRYTPDTKTVRNFVSEMQSAGFKVVTVTQVQQDRALNDEIARVCQIEHIDWPESRSHLAQESLVVSVYNRSVAVVSDRLHALIIGGRYGAVPVIADRVEEDKLHATLDSLLMPQSVWLHGGRRPEGAQSKLDLTVRERERIASAFASAATSLEAPLASLVEKLDS